MGATSSVILSVGLNLLRQYKSLSEHSFHLGQVLQDLFTQDVCNVATYCSCSRTPNLNVAQRHDLLRPVTVELVHKTSRTSPYFKLFRDKFCVHFCVCGNWNDPG